MKTAEGPEVQSRARRLWGPYLWADGTTPRKSDGLIYESKDVDIDGTHPSESGRKKVAELLLRFFQTDPVVGVGAHRPEDVSCCHLQRRMGWEFRC
jgi:hypothetical protein